MDRREDNYEERDDVTVHVEVKSDVTSPRLAFALETVGELAEATAGHPPAT